MFGAGRPAQARLDLVITMASIPPARYRVFKNFGRYDSYYRAGCSDAEGTSAPTNYTGARDRGWSPVLAERQGAGASKLGSSNAWEHQSFKFWSSLLTICRSVIRLISG
jgi:hypothetical protein